MRLRCLVFIVWFAGAALPASAAEKTTVARLEQIIAENVTSAHRVEQQSHNSDEISEIAGSDLLGDVDGQLVSRLADIELNERLSTLSLYRLAGKYKLGARSQMVLQLIADRSSLLKLPPGEQIARSAPDAETQGAMFNAARDYVFGKLSHLPDFVATRTTTTFDDASGTLKLLLPGIDTSGFHRRASTQQEITFRDGKEVLASTGEAVIGKFAETQKSFESRGEFGTQAAVLLMDLQQGSVSFDHWEEMLGGIAAVYQYSVPRTGSHYEVTDLCEGQAPFHDMPGYSGTIALLPATGAILRITLEVESDKGDPVSHVASVIEYGPVLIENRRFVCPLRSLAFMVQDASGCSQHRHKLQKPVSIFNRTIFSNYHRFGSSSTMIYGEVNGKEPNAGTAPNRPEHSAHSTSERRNESGVQHKQP